MSCESESPVLLAPVESVSCLGATHIPQRWDEAGQAYTATADDAAYATFELKGHDGGKVVAHVNSSWTTRVRRDDLGTFHVDGTHGSAVAGLQSCRAQSRVTTPRPVWNPDEKQMMNFFDQWQEVPDSQFYDNGFKIQWEHFIRHVGRRRALQVDAARRRQGRATGRGRAAELERAALGGRATAINSIAVSSPAHGGWRPILLVKPIPRHFMSASLVLPGADGALRPYTLRGTAPVRPARGTTFNRIAYPAAHVVADPRAAIDPWLQCAVDWDATIA